MITPDRIKAFLDDLALVSVIHGIQVIGRIDEDIVLPAIVEIERHPDPFCGYSADPDEVDVCHILGSSGGSRTADMGGVQSIDVSNISAHQRIARSKAFAQLRGIVG